MTFHRITVTINGTAEILDVPVGDWRALFRDAGFRSEFRDSVGRTPLFQGDTAPLRVQQVGADRFKGLVGLPVSEVAATTDR